MFDATSRRYIMTGIASLLLLLLCVGIQYVDRTMLGKYDETPSWKRSLEIRPEAGLAVAMIQGNTTKLMWFGSLSKKDQYKNFEIGSTTKIFTGLMLERAVDNRSISLDDSVCRFVPELHWSSRIAKCPSLGLLATNESGLPKDPTNLKPHSIDDPYGNFTESTLVDFFNQYNRSFSSNPHFQYSNVGYALIGLALARHQGKTYSQLLSSTIVSPMHLKSTFVTDDYRTEPLLLNGHEPYGRVAPHYHFRAMTPAGGISSSLEDIATVVRCNLGEGALGKMCANTHDSASRRFKSNFGWFHSNGYDFVKGDTNGFSSMIVIDQKYRCGIIILANERLNLSNISQHFLIEDKCA